MRLLSKTLSFLKPIQLSIIICHEGLPRSGKSYEAAVNQIIPALKKFRKVFARLDGLNYEKFAELTEFDIETVQSLLIHLTPEQIPEVYKHVENDSLVIIDELQDFFPSAERKLDKGMTEFVTQHGHRGIDILVMGQSHEDFNILWKRRIDRLFYFIKRDAAGFPDHYTWIVYKNQRGRFVKVNKGKGKYDEKYFGLYASHTKGVSSIDDNADDRANILKTAFFKYLPVFGLVFIYAIYYLYGVFHGDNGFVPKSAPKTAEAKPQTPVVTPPTPIPVPAQAQLAPPPPPADPHYTQKEMNSYKGFLSREFELYRARLGVVLSAKATGDKPARLYAIVEFYDKNNHLVDSFNTKQLTELGYTFRQTDLGLVIKGGDGEFIAKSWQRDDPRDKRVDERPLNRERTQSGEDRHYFPFQTVSFNEK